MLYVLVQDMSAIVPQCISNRKKQHLGLSYAKILSKEKVMKKQIKTNEKLEISL